MRLLEAALAPVEPPAGLGDELEERLADVQAAALEALEELADWEIAAMRDPRNWVRPGGGGRGRHRRGRGARGAADAPRTAPALAACAASPTRAAASCSTRSRDARAPDRARRRARRAAAHAGRNPLGGRRPFC